MKSFRWASNFCPVNQPDAEGGFAEDVLSRQGEKMRQDIGLNLSVLSKDKERELYGIFGHRGCH